MTCHSDTAVFKHARCDCIRCLLYWFVNVEFWRNMSLAGQCGILEKHVTCWSVWNSRKKLSLAGQCGILEKICHLLVSVEF